MLDLKYTLPFDITDINMKVKPMAHPFFMAIPFNMDIKPCTGEKTFIYWTGKECHENNLNAFKKHFLRFSITQIFKKEKAIPIKF